MEEDSERIALANRQIKAVQAVMNVPDSNLRNYLYFMCGWQPDIMLQVAECLDQLRKEDAEHESPSV